MENNNSNNTEHPKVQNFQQMPVQQYFQQQPITELEQMPLQQLQQEPVGFLSQKPIAQYLQAYPAEVNKWELKRMEEEKRKYIVSDEEMNEITQLKYNDDEPLDHNLIIEATKATENSLLSDVEGAIKLSLNLKKKIVQSSSLTTQIFPMLASLSVENLKSTKRAPLDLVCVIDHSGSMYGDRIKLVKDSFNYLLKYLGDLDRLSIVIFDHTASRIVPLLRTTEANKEKFLNALKDVREAGSTDINLGMMHAFHILKQRRYHNPITSIFLLSDGVDKYAQSKIKMSIEKFGMSDDFTINSFGFTRYHDPELMTNLATLRDGNFYFIDQIDTVNEAFVDCLGGLLSAVAQNARIAIKPEQSNILQGVELVKAYGNNGMWDREDQTYITKIGTLVSGKQKGFVLDIQIPILKNELQDNYDKNVKIASAEAELTTLDNKIITKKAELYITLLKETEELKEEPEDDREVMKNFYRVKGASLLQKARHLADQKDYKEAVKLLQGLKEELENSFLKTEEFIKNLVKDIDQAIKDVSPEVFEKVGRHNMMMNERAQMQQRSNLASGNHYQNSMQEAMLSEVRLMKNQK